MGTGETATAVPNSVLERERRLMRPVGIAAIASVALVVGSLFIVQGTVPGDTDAARLQQFHDNSSKLVSSSFVRGLGFGLIGVPVLFLFNAARARSERVAERLKWLLVVAPIFLAISTVLNAFAFDEIATKFVEMKGATTDPEQLAEDLSKESNLLQVASGIGLAGTFGVAAGVLYASLWGMRTGLLTRFLGTFGMAVAVVFILIPFGVLIWCIAFGFLLIGLQPGGRPPAWEAGVAMPWPRPGDEPPPETPTDVVEGRGSELPADDSTDEGGESSQPGPPKRKRKRRG